MLAHALAFHGGRWTAADVAALRASRPEFQEVRQADGLRLGLQVLLWCNVAYIFPSSPFVQLINFVGRRRTTR